VKLHRELAAAPEKTYEDLDRREALQWNIRRVEHRIVDLRSRLTGRAAEAEGAAATTEDDA
jgi:hypothetical protein